jgi:hypothetical protein
MQNPEDQVYLLDRPHNHPNSRKMQSEVTAYILVRISYKLDLTICFTSIRLLEAFAYMYAEMFDSAELAASTSCSNPKANHWARIVQVSSLIHLGQKERALEVKQQALKQKPELTVDLVERAFPVKVSKSALPIRDGLIEAGLPGVRYITSIQYPTTLLAERTLLFGCDHKIYPSISRTTSSRFIRGNGTGFTKTGIFNIITTTKRYEVI